MQSRVVFMGTPEFAVPALDVLAERIERENLLVITQPDRAAGRGRKLHPPPVRVAADRLELSIDQVATLRDAGIRERLVAFAPDLIVVAAFGLLLPKWVLQLPPRGCVNLHASILPRFRGASPIPAAIACGDARTGVALMEMEAGLDTGGVYALQEIEIASSDTTDSLTERLAVVAAEVLSVNLDALLAGSLQPDPQQGQIVETRKIAKAHGAINWEMPAEEIELHIRAMWPWPRAWTIGANEVRMQIHQADVVPDVRGEPGTVMANATDGVMVAAGDGALRLLRVQLPGKPAQEVGTLRQHRALSPGAKFESPAGEVDPWIVIGGEAGD